MLDFVDWLVQCGVGIIFGLFPAWWWFGAEVANAKLFKNKRIPGWILKVLESDPAMGILSLTLKNGRRFVKTLRVTSIVWVAAIIILWISFGIINVNGWNGFIFNLISLVPFMILTWLIPAFLLKRYLQKSNHFSPDTQIDFPVSFSTKSQTINNKNLISLISSVIFTFILLAVVVYFTGYFKELTFWIASFIEVIWAVLTARTNRGRFYFLLMGTLTPMILGTIFYSLSPVMVSIIVYLLAYLTVILISKNKTKNFKNYMPF